MTGAKPTAILIVHGGYFLPPAWDALSNRLRKAGFVVQCPRLPSCGDKRPPTALREHDVAAVRKVAQELIDAGHSILVLAHSYGGMVASEAITKDLYASGGNGVVSLIYLSAWLLQPGSTLEDVITKYGFQSEVDLGNNGDGTVFAKNAPESFYNDLEPETAEEFARGNVTHNWGAALGPMKGAPWKDLPTTYVHCTQDMAIMHPLQQSMVQDAVNAGGKLIVETIDAGHCPFLSQPEEIVRIVSQMLPK
ncbi:alpha/beta-hydrolase [Penicillium riverlandense]|uniref:alpha/beta-hydrolase n=1 Tax=Penicillium riverlandense TaxID=1903569 RepID=UPI00254680AC|nr:alpha/beta-hydrolase [Penicillium riverlandense]KAJ5825734.1 alpha/beta-hydrolase [Penicillium riverlandense]